MTPISPTKSVASRQSSPAGFGCQGPSYISPNGRWTFRHCGVQTCTSPTHTNTRGPHSSGPWLALGYQCVKTKGHRLQVDTVLQGFRSRPGGSDRGREEGGMPSLQAAEPACLFLPPRWAQGRHFWVDEDARLQPLSAKGRRGPGAF